MQDLDLRRARLLARIRREFGTIEERVEIGASSLPFTRVRDPDAVLDAVCRQESDRARGVASKRPLRMPYWAAVWESALALANHLATTGIPACAASSTNGNGCATVEALDLGCGMGLVGMAMASLGCRVTLVDVETACLLFARLNTLRWDCRVRRCDWQSDDLDDHFDVIVGSDVLYDVTQWPFVEAFARRHLRPGGAVLIGEPGRPKAEAFPGWIRAKGWALTATRFAQGERLVNVLELRLAR